MFKVGWGEETQEREGEEKECCLGSVGEGKGGALDTLHSPCHPLCRQIQSRLRERDMFTRG